MTLKIPWKVGTPSFIIPGTWEENCEYLHNKVDYIQLLLLEDIPNDQLPSKDEISKLKFIKNKYNLTYTAHLPHRIQFSHPQKDLRNNSIERIKKIFDLIDDVGIKYYVLHPYIYDTAGDDFLKSSLYHFQNSLSELLSYYPFPRKIGLESLHFNFHHLAPIIKELDTSVIIDIGQALRYKKDYFSYINTYFERIIDIHLRGFDGIKDHESLSYIDPLTIRNILKTLIDKKYKKNMLIEIFTESNFNESMTILDKLITKL